MKRSNLFTLIICLFTLQLTAQNRNNASSLLWKVTDKNLKKPSYLFGTFHLLTNAFIDMRGIYGQKIFYYTSC